MTLQEQINNDIKLAMKARDADRLAALRAVKSAIMLEATKEGISSISDEVCLKLIAKLVKQRKDAADIFLQQDRKDLAQDEMNQLAFLQLYLPVQMEENEVREIVKEVIAKTSASSSADIGKCMGILMRRLNGKADGTLISRLVRELLS
tara:strand:- start:1679 stop:2125 length:447 start_codon:yes stop_codon:yes gene_type:complete